MPNKETTRIATEHSELPPMTLKPQHENPNYNTKIHSCYRAIAKGKEVAQYLNKYLYNINIIDYKYIYVQYILYIANCNSHIFLTLM